MIDIALPSRFGTGGVAIRSLLVLPIGVSVFDHKVAVLDVTEVTQSLDEGGDRRAGVRTARQESAYASDLGFQLRLSRKGTSIGMAGGESSRTLAQAPALTMTRSFDNL
jgi:hypothetical protein